MVRLSKMKTKDSLVIIIIILLFLIVLYWLCRSMRSNVRESFYAEKNEEDSYKNGTWKKYVDKSDKEDYKWGNTKSYKMKKNTDAKKIFNLNYDITDKDGYYWVRDKTNTEKGYAVVRKSAKDEQYKFNPFKSYSDNYLTKEWKTYVVQPNQPCFYWVDNGQKISSYDIELIPEYKELFIKDGKQYTYFWINDTKKEAIPQMTSSDTKFIPNMALKETDQPNICHAIRFQDNKLQTSCETSTSMREQEYYYINMDELKKCEQPIQIIYEKDTSVKCKIPTTTPSAKTLFEEWRKHVNNENQKNPAKVWNNFISYPLNNNAQKLFNTKYIWVDSKAKTAFLNDSIGLDLKQIDNCKDVNGGYNCSIYKNKSNQQCYTIKEVNECVSEGNKTYKNKKKIPDRIPLTTMFIPTTAPTTTLKPVYVMPNKLTISDPSKWSQCKDFNINNNELTATCNNGDGPKFNQSFGKYYDTACNNNTTPCCSEFAHVYGHLEAKCNFVNGSGWSKKLQVLLDPSENQNGIHYCQKNNNLQYGCKKSDGSYGCCPEN
jgi:hypothetical protein